MKRSNCFPIIHPSAKSKCKRILKTNEPLNFETILKIYLKGLFFTALGNHITLFHARNIHSYFSYLGWLEAVLKCKILCMSQKLNHQCRITGRHPVYLSILTKSVLRKKKKNSKKSIVYSLVLRITLTPTAAILTFFFFLFPFENSDRAQNKIDF